MAAFEFPEYYALPPFFTLQVNETSRENQTRWWRELILGYAQHTGEYHLEVQAALDSPLCHNAAIGRRLDADALVYFLNDLVKTRNAEWENAERTMVLLMPQTPEEVAQDVYDWVVDAGMIGDVLTVYELHSGDSSVGTSFHGSDPTLVLRALDVLAAQGKAKVFSASSPEDAGVKFFAA